MNHGRTVGLCTLQKATITWDDIAATVACDVYKAIGGVQYCVIRNPVLRQHMLRYPMRNALLRICKTEAVTESLVSLPVVSQRHRRACHQLVCHESGIDIIVNQTLYMFPGMGKYILHRIERDTSSSVDGGSQIP